MRGGGGKRSLGGITGRWDGGAEIKNDDFATSVFRAFKQSLSCGSYRRLVMTGNAGKRGKLASENTGTNDED